MPARILVTGALHESALSALQKLPGVEVDYRPDCDRKTLLASVSEATVLLTRSETDVDQEVLTAATRLKVVARAAVGVGNIDIPFATERGILVVNTPGRNTNSAAEMTLGLILALLRKIPAASREVATGGWDRHRFSGRELRGKRLGIVGLGNVGHRVAKFGLGFDMDVFSYDPYIAPEVFLRHGAKRAQSLADLARECDILTVHVPLNDETKGMIDGRILRTLPAGSWVINAARGGVIVENDLLACIEDGHIAGAGIDTWEKEPRPIAKLATHTNVVGTPHIGASTDEAQIAVGQTIVDQVAKALEGSVVDFPVNLPSFGMIDNPEQRAYAVLAEKLGSLAAQVKDFNPSRVTLSYRGQLASQNHSLIRLSWIKGYVAEHVEDYVSFVNAEAHLDRLGIRIDEVADPGFVDYRAALKVTLHGIDQNTLAVGGTTFDSTHIRISMIDGFCFETEPSGHLLVIRNADKPGVVGDIGHFLSSHGVNISSFELSRNRLGGTAMALVRLDSPLAARDVFAMRQLPHVITVRAIRL